MNKIADKHRYNLIKFLYKKKREFSSENIEKINIRYSTWDSKYRSHLINLGIIYISSKNGKKTNYKVNSDNLSKFIENEFYIHFTNELRKFSFLRTKVMKIARITEPYDTTVMIENFKKKKIEMKEILPYIKDERTRTKWGKMTTLFDKLIYADKCDIKNKKYEDVDNLGEYCFYIQMSEMFGEIFYEFFAQTSDNETFNYNTLKKIPKNLHNYGSLNHIDKLLENNNSDNREFLLDRRSHLLRVEEGVIKISDIFWDNFDINTPAESLSELFDIMIHKIGKSTEEKVYDEYINVYTTAIGVPYIRKKFKMYLFFYALYLLNSIQTNIENVEVTK